MKVARDQRVRTRRLLRVSLLGTILGLGCAPINGSNFLNTITTPTSGKYLYVVSGYCYGGGVTTSTGSNTVVKYNLRDGSFAGMVTDYSDSPNDTPVGIVDWDTDNVLVAIENAGGRRIDIVNKKGNGRSTWVSNATALIANLRGIAKTSDGGVIVPRSSGASAIEKFSSAKSRITNGANPFINALAGNCATSSTMMVNAFELPNGSIFFSHAAATANNMVGIASSSGASCLTAAKITGFAATALPTCAIYHSSGKLIIAYGSTTLASNGIYGYDLNLTTSSITSATAAYTDTNVVQGPSAMIEDTYNGYVLIASALSTLNSIEKFTFSSSTKTLTRVGTNSYIRQSVYTKCISGMAIGD